MAVLNDEELAAALAQLPGWQQEHHAIRRVYEFPDFREAMKFAVRVADLADAANHHPDLLVQWGRVTVTTWSHDAGGVTKRDLALAHAIDD